MKLQKLDDLILNLVVAFEARRIKGVTPLWVTEAAKQLVIHIRRGKISALILIDSISPSLAAEGAMHEQKLCFNLLARFAHCSLGTRALLLL